MSEIVRDGLLLLLGTCGTAATCLLLERVWPAVKRRPNNELLAWQLQVFGGVYAIILGFMLYTVWNDFQAAKGNVGAEANALVNVSRLSAGLPEEQRVVMKTAARAYAVSMIRTEWPAMEQSSLPRESHVLIEQMWTTLETVRPDGSTQATLLDHALTELASLTEHRRVREVGVFDRLPAILWLVLLSGAGMVVAWSCCFGAMNRGVHAALVGSLAFLLTLMLLTIAAIDRPFQGSLRVPVEAFVRAAQTLEGQ